MKVQTTEVSLPPLGERQKFYTIEFEAAAIVTFCIPETDENRGADSSVLFVHQKNAGEPVVPYVCTVVRSNAVANVADDALNVGSFGCHVYGYAHVWVERVKRAEAPHT